MPRRMEGAKLGGGHCGTEVRSNLVCGEDKGADELDAGRRVEDEFNVLSAGRPPCARKKASGRLCRLCWQRCSGCRCRCRGLLGRGLGGSGSRALSPARLAPSPRCPPLPPSSPISPPRIFARDSRPLSGPSSPLPSSMFADANPNLVYCLRCLCVCVRVCACVCTLAAPSAAPGRASPRPPSPPRAALAQMATACLSSVAASLPPSPNCHRYVSMRPPPCPLRSCSSSLPPPSFLPQQTSLSLNMAPITLAYASCRARLPAASNWTMSPAASRESLMAISATAFPL